MSITTFFKHKHTTGEEQQAKSKDFASNETSHQTKLNETTALQEEQQAHDPYMHSFKLW
jgi:hypothetical protein